MRPSNVIDIDAVRVDALMAEEKETLTKEGHCFKCKKQGHISRRCPERKEKGNALHCGNQGMTMHMTAIEEGNAQSKVEELARGIKELGDEEKKGLLDLLLEKGF
jgi:Zinc knuckle